MTTTRTDVIRRPRPVWAVLVALVALSLTFAGTACESTSEEPAEEKAAEGEEESQEGGEEGETGEDDESAESAEGEPAEPETAAGDEDEATGEETGAEEVEAAAAMIPDLPEDPTAVATPEIPPLEIPYTEYTLANGLRLVVHEDPKAPIAAVNVWYHVGSKNEAIGRTGFAHLFEHLMFQGSENYDGEYFEPFEKVGATDMNGTTNGDRTNYFQNVPTPALDMALWMESDRMGHFEGAITQDLLDEQRGVVQNEKRQGLNQPYGEVRELLPAHTYPKGHPYSWSTIGSMEDLDAATLDDVKGWFAKWYGASNATVVVAGDVSAEDVKARVEKYFGDIQPGPPNERPDVWIAPMKEDRRLAIEDQVPHARVYKTWNVPQWGSAEAIHLDLATNVLAAGKTSRLYERLVYRDELATDVRAYISAREIGGQVTVFATARDGIALADLEKALDEEMNRFIAEGPSAAELDRARTQYFSGTVYGLERIGGFGGKSDVLARSAVYGGSPDAYLKNHDHARNTTPETMQKTLQTWLGDKGSFALEVYPSEAFAEVTTAKELQPRSELNEPDMPAAVPMTPAPESTYTAAEAGADRSKLPDTGEPPELELPELQRATLSNGLQVVLAERHEAPVVRMNLVVDAGYASDQFASPGLANLAMRMLDEGTTERDTLAISEILERLGADIGTGSGLDTSYVTLSTLEPSLPQALALYAEVIQKPAFAAEELERQRKQVLSQIRQEKAQPIQIALRLLGPTIYGDGHAYGLPLTGSGTEAAVKAVTRNDLVSFHETWIRPDLATLVVVGDTTMDELKPMLESAFSEWSAPETEAKKKNLAEIEDPAPRLLLIDKPGAEQSLLIAGHLAPAREEESNIAYKVANGVLGGTFTSRINMNLREDKHWSYGSRSFIWDTKGQRLFVAYGAVQSDKTAESMVEIKKELDEILDARPVAEAEASKIKDSFTLKLPGENETTAELLSGIREIVEYGLPDDHWQKYVGRVRGLDVAAVQEATKALVRPDQNTWIVVGDLATIHAPVTALGWADVEVIDADGNAVDWTPPPAVEAETPKKIEKAVKPKVKVVPGTKLQAPKGGTKLKKVPAPPKKTPGKNKRVISPK